MPTLTKGQTYGATEQITNTKLHNLVDLATIDMTVGVAIGTTTSLAGSFSTASATAAYLNSISASGGNVGGTWQTDTLRLDITPTAASASGQNLPFHCQHFFTVNLNGTTYYVPCASATA